MEVSLRRFLQVASSKREASGLDPEAVHEERADMEKASYVFTLDVD